MDSNKLSGWRNKGSVQLSMSGIAQRNRQITCLEMQVRNWLCSLKQLRQHFSEVFGLT